MNLYLWLNCEGWVPFGPFEWLRFDDGKNAILDEKGNVIAVRDGNGWSTPGQYEGFAWQNAMVTASPRHPHLNHG